MIDDAQNVRQNNNELLTSRLVKKLAEKSSKMSGINVESSALGQSGFGKYGQKLSKNEISIEGRVW